MRIVFQTVAKSFQETGEQFPLHLLTPFMFPRRRWGQRNSQKDLQRTFKEEPIVSQYLNSSVPNVSTHLSKAIGKSTVNKIESEFVSFDMYYNHHLLAVVSFKYRCTSEWKVMLKCSAKIIYGMSDVLAFMYFQFWTNH